MFNVQLVAACGYVNVLYVILGVTVVEVESGREVIYEIRMWMELREIVVFWIKILEKCYWILCSGLRLLGREELGCGRRCGNEIGLREYG
nr:hypothetical protein [Tanacetum cinerariifolium]